MSEPTPGQKYTKNNIEFTVHFVENGNVYGVLYRADDNDESSLDLPLDEWYIPTGCLGAVQCPLDEFLEQTKDCVVT